MDVPGAPRIRDAFFLPRAIISNAESKAISKKERERQAVDGPLGDLKEHYIFLLLNVPLPPKQGFHMAPKKAIDLYIHIDQALFFILSYHF